MSMSMILLFYFLLLASLVFSILTWGEIRRIRRHLAPRSTGETESPRLDVNHE